MAQVATKLNVFQEFPRWYAKTSFFQQSRVKAIMDLALRDFYSLEDTLCNFSRHIPLFGDSRA
jgi:hypothetical protein